MKKTRNKIKLTLGERVFSIINGLVMLICALVCVYPLYYIIIFSVSDPNKIGSGITLYPKGFSLATYKVILTNPEIYNAMFVSVARTVVGTLVALALCSLLAFLVVQKDMPMRKLIYRFVVASMYLSAGLIPWYLLMTKLGLKNNFLLYILPMALSAFNVVLIKTYIEQLPSSLQEAAELDGAGYFRIYRSIILPLCKPILATIAVFVAVTQWNSWTDNFYLVSDPSLQTLQMVLYRILSEASNIALRNMTGAGMGNTAFVTVSVTPQTVKMCITVVVTLPILFVYPFVQKYFTSGIMVGAIKG